MVQHAIENPEVEWMYPEHYQQLLAVIGGPLIVKVENTDPSVFKRWANVDIPSHPNAATPSTQPPPTIAGNQGMISKRSDFLYNLSLAERPSFPTPSEFLQASYNKDMESSELVIDEYRRKPTQIVAPPTVTEGEELETFFNNEPSGYTGPIVPE
jgi:hypothetical protein